MYANRLKLLRISLSLNQEDFGKLFNYSKQAISYFEKSQREIPAQLIDILKSRYGDSFGLTVGARGTVPEPPPRDKGPIPYQQPAETMRVVNSSDAGSYGLPDLSRHAGTVIFEPDIEIYVRMTRDILTSGHVGTIAALKSNLVAFHDQVRDKAQLKAMNENLDRLNKEIITLKTIAGGCAETSAERETGNE
jgi:transcriptional regulator with XRE-family HTH domain